MVENLNTNSNKTNGPYEKTLSGCTCWYVLGHDKMRAQIWFCSVYESYPRALHSYSTIISSRYRNKIISLSFSLSLAATHTEWP